MTDSKFKRILKNGISIRGQFAMLGKFAARIELYISIPGERPIWSETSTNFASIDPQEELLRALDALEAQVKDACVDQVPRTHQGMILIKALLAEMDKRRNPKRKVA